MEKQNILAQRLKRAKSRDQNHQTSSLIQLQSDDSQLLSFAQERFWFLSQLEPENPLLNRPFAWRLTGNINPEFLAQATSTIIERHHILRTLYADQDGSLIPTLSPETSCDISLIDLSSVALSGRQTAVEAQLKTLSHTPIPLDSPVLVRTTLIKVSEAEHILLFMMHHVTFDAISEEIFKNEFRQIYAALLQNRPPKLKTLPFQYGDFAKQQRRAINGPGLEQLESFWTSQLAGAPHILPLPTDRKRPMIGSNQGGRVNIRFPTELTKQLKKLSLQQDVTLFMTLLAGFFLLLNRYTNQEDILIGTPTSGRTQAETKNLIGFFTNTLVLRGDFSADPTFAQLLSRIRAMTLQSLEHQAYPIEKLFESIQVTREANIPPLFQVLFNLENNLPTTNIPDGPIIEPFEMHQGSASFDLAIELQMQDDNLIGQFNYNHDLFDASTIENMASHYLTLLQSAVDQTDMPASQLDILTPQKKNQILYAWNENNLDYDHNKCIHEAFEQVVLELPNKIALSGQGNALTYQELNEAANQMAHHLVQLGVQPNTLVGIYLERSVGMVIGLLAILKAGGAYVPIDPYLPADRTDFMLRDSGINIVLTQKAWVHQLPEFITHSLCVDDLPANVLNESRENVTVGGLSSNNLAYMVYTSGSTGLPKGAMIAHRSLYNFVRTREAEGIYTRKQSVLQSTTLSFDAAVVGIFCPLLTGGRMVLAGPDGFKDLDETLEIIKQEKVTAFSCSPTVLGFCLDSPKFAECTSLTQGFVGGEVLTTDLKDRWIKQTGLPLYNGYGPTETTIGVTVHKCELHSPYASVPIGRASANGKIYILDRHLNPVPIGVPAELFIGGDPVGLGYWKRADLTAEKFLPNRYAPGKIYRTGDLARYLPDGNIEYLGRIDHQVKVRGFRIELGEIETALLDHPAVRQAKVLATKVNASDQLVAYIATDQHQSTSLPSELRQMIGQKLPAYMVPPFIILMEQFPLMLSGKINLKALSKPNQSDIQSNLPFAEPTTETEVLLAQIWQDILNIKKVSADDNFFELGGHSLLVTKVIARIRSTIGIDFPMKTFFESPKLADQAEMLELMLVLRQGQNDGNCF